MSTAHRPVDSDDEQARLHDRVRHLGELRNLITDERAIAAVETLIDEINERLRQIEPK